MQPPDRCSNHRYVYIDQCGVCHWYVSLPYGAVGWSEVGDCYTHFLFMYQDYSLAFSWLLPLLCPLFS